MFCQQSSLFRFSVESLTPWISRQCFLLTRVKTTPYISKLRLWPWTIEFYLNTEIWADQKAGYKNRRRPSCFSPLLLYRGKGWTASLIENFNKVEFSPRLKLPLYNLGGSTHWYSSIQFSSKPLKQSTDTNRTHHHRDHWLDWVYHRS